MRPRSQKTVSFRPTTLFSTAPAITHRKQGFGWRKIIAVASALMIVLGVFFSPVATVLNNSILDWRMGTSSLAPSGRIVFVAIDPRSLREVGTWPWSRSLHADILDNLMAAGAVDVFFDIDFAFPSDAPGDAQFAASLERAGGATLIATFAQLDRVTDGTSISYNLPYGPFREWSWPASVNVSSGTDGLIRSYPSGVRIEGQFTPSAAFLLAGGTSSEDRHLQINYSISPSDIPVLSAVDVARGNFTSDMVRGRSIIVGAASVELGDYFAVPLHQVIPGALVHALATETLILDAEITRARADLLAIAFAVLIVMTSIVKWKSPWRPVGLIAVAMVAVEAWALYLFHATFVSLPTAFVHPSLVAYTVMMLAGSLDFSRILLRRQDIQIRNSQALLNHLFEHSSDGVVILDHEGDILMQSQSAERIFGTTGSQHLNLPIDVRRLARAAQDETQQDAQIGTVTLPGDDGPRHIEYLVTPSTYHQLASDKESPKSRQIAAISARDVTDLKRQEREIAYLSTHDERTGALRRQPFLEVLSLRLGRTEPTVVFAMTLEGLKTIALSFGRDVSDGVLEQAVTRLQSLDLGLSSIARLEGTSFAFFLEGSALGRDIAQLARTIQSSVSECYNLPDASVHVEANIGYNEIAPQANLSAERALRRAEDALDAGVASDARGVFAYAPAVARKRERIRAVERAMPGAVERGELYVLYQTQHRLEDNALIGVEALVRWQHPDLGQVFPDEFIPIAESNGFISKIGQFVLNRAVDDAMKIPSNVVMAVNVSSVQFRIGRLLEDVQKAIARSRLPPERLCLELTESVMLEEDKSTIEKMQDIAFSGVTWAMDDFGTGFSSMAYLSSLPLAKVKLDRSFTMALHNDPSARVILRSVQGLCDGLGIGLLCEGVETDEHRDILLEEGCSEGQGYFYSRPTTLEDILATHCESKGLKTLQ